jgi:hypothetical protein
MKGKNKSKSKGGSEIQKILATSAVVWFRKTRLFSQLLLLLAYINDIYQFL